MNHPAKSWAALLGLALTLGMSAAARATDTLNVTGVPPTTEISESIPLNGVNGPRSVANLYYLDDPAVVIERGRNAVNIDENGKITGAIDVQNGAVVINNSGLIYALDTADATAVISGGTGTDGYYSDTTLNNSGIIKGSIESYDRLRINNTGEIIGGMGDASAIHVHDGAATLLNLGRIAGVYDGEMPRAIFVEAVSGDNVHQPALTLDNRGRIEGNIENNGFLNVVNGGDIYGDLQNYGTVNLGTAKIHLQKYTDADSSEIIGGGNYNVGETEPASGTLNFAIAGANYGQLIADGDVDLSATDVKVTVYGGVADKHYQLVKAQGELTIGSRDLQIDSRSLTLDYQQQIFQPDADGFNSIGISATAKPHAFNNNSTGGDKNLGTALDRLAPTAKDSPLSATFAKLNAVTDPAELKQKISRLNNRLFTAMQNRQVTEAINANMNALRSALRELSGANLGVFSRGLARASLGGATAGGGATGAAAFNRQTFFARMYGGFGGQDDKGDDVGYDTKHFGVLGGADYMFARELRLGILGGYGYNTAKLHEGRGESSDHSFRAGLYGNFNWDGIYLDVSPTVALHYLNGERETAYAGKAKNDRFGWDVNVFLNAGYMVNLPYHTYVTPEFSLSPSVFHSLQYAEKGAGDENLAVDSFTNWSLLQVLRVKIGGVFDFGIGTRFQPEFTLGWEHEYINAGGDVESAFSVAENTKWKNSSVAKPDGDRFLMGIGLGVLLNDSLTITGKWEQRWWGGGYDTSFSLAGVLSY
ncbi:MAG: autotransporter outer membrane beta-barrel domain-containing protein [Planctomycetota bacterium]|jgi:uncharacterized protein with beta-barrel porin domain|nr:autotransporter outer membrane beta-barrel domain-containing protein [Planctomycetota bacterium]